MSLREELHRIDFERARAAPAGAFVSPDAVLADKRFSAGEKLEVLRQWTRDTDLLAIAETEGMAGGEPAMSGRVLAALFELQTLMVRGSELSVESRGPLDGGRRDR